MSYTRHGYQKWNQGPGKRRIDHLTHHFKSKYKDAPHWKRSLKGAKLLKSEGVVTKADYDRWYNSKFDYAKPRADPETISLELANKITIDAAPPNTFTTQHHVVLAGKHIGADTSISISDFDITLYIHIMTTQVTLLEPVVYLLIHPDFYNGIKRYDLLGDPRPTSELYWEANDKYIDIIGYDQYYVSHLRDLPPRGQQAPIAGTAVPYHDPLRLNISNYVLDKKEYVSLSSSGSALKKITFKFRASKSRPAISLDKNDCISIASFWREGTQKPQYEIQFRSECIFQFTRN